VAVGFGISTPRLAAALAPSTDGIIVGSALTDQIQQLTQSGHDAGILLSKLTEFAGGFRQAIDAV
jgi:tryptophan synthase alpha subunit